MAISTALVVDDSRLARVTMTKLLEKRTVAVNQASSAREALEYLRGNRPDVILMDVTMPDIDGLEATRMITGNPETTNIPVVMCTAEDTDEARQRASECGAMGFLTKPASGENIDRVIAEIAERLGLSEQEDTNAGEHSDTTQDGAQPLDVADIEARVRELVNAALEQARTGILTELAEQAVQKALDRAKSEGGSQAQLPALESIRKAATGAAAETSREVAQRVAREFVQTEAKGIEASATQLAQREAKQVAESSAAVLREQLSKLQQSVNDSRLMEQQLTSVAREAAREATSEAIKKLPAPLDADQIETRTRAIAREAINPGVAAALRDFKQQEESTMAALESSVRSAITTARTAMIAAGLAAAASIAVGLLL